MDTSHRGRKRKRKEHHSVVGVVKKNEGGKSGRRNVKEATAVKYNVMIEKRHDVGVETV